MSAQELGDIVTTRKGRSPVFDNDDDNNRSRRLLSECRSSIITVSAVVTHPEQARQSAIDALTTSFFSSSFLVNGLTETGNCDDDDDDVLGVSILSVGTIFFRTIRRRRRGTTTTTEDSCFNLDCTSSPALWPSVIFLDGWNNGFTHACEGDR